MPANAKVEGPHRGARSEPRAHTVFPRPRRDYGASRPLPTIVRSQDPRPENRLTRQEQDNVEPVRGPAEAQTACDVIGMGRGIGGWVLPDGLECPEGDPTRFRPFKQFGWSKRHWQNHLAWSTETLDECRKRAIEERPRWRERRD